MKSPTHPSCARLRFALVTLAASSACAGTTKRVPDFHGTTRDGRVIMLSDYVTTMDSEVEEERAKDVLLSFFATWCEPCRRELPQLVAYQKQRPEDLQVIVVALPSDDIDRVLNELLPPDTTPFPVIIDRDRAVTRVVFGKRDFVLPSTFLIRKSGKLAAYLRGFTSGESLRKQLYDARRSRR